MAKKSNLIKLGDAIDQLFKDAKLDVKISRFSVKNSWKEIVGEVISKNTSGIFYNDKVIFVTLSSAALKHELSFRKQEIVDNINRFCGYKLVEDIVIK
jgi:predicted nucleic acid-binding Zn ribbon protein